MAKSRQLAAVLADVKAIQKMESLGTGEVASLRTVIGGKQTIAKSYPAGFAIAPITKIILRHSLTQRILDMVSGFERTL